MTYDSSLSTSRDKVRFLIGDTSNSSATELLADGEITWLLSEESSDVYRTAVAAAEAVAAKFSRLADTSVGDTSVSASQKAEAYRKLAADLRTKALERGTAAPFAGGISISDRDTREADTDRPAMAFDRLRPEQTDPADTSRYPSPAYFAR